LPSPAAKASVPLAVLFSPNAAEPKPTLPASHCEPFTLPARTAALAGYHIIRTPEPVSGMFPLLAVPVET
jgi:hypothetical protein